MNEALIASMASGLLDDYSVTSLTDQTALGRFMAREFGTVRREVLEEYPYSFAKKRAVLTETTAPAFGWRAAYVLPTDYRAAKRVYDPCNYTDDKPVPFTVESGHILTNVQGGLWLVYTRDENNLAKWTALGGRVFAAKLAMYASQRVTGKASYFYKCQDAYEKALWSAKTSDALNSGMVEDVYTSGSTGQDVVTARGAYA